MKFAPAPGVEFVQFDEHGLRVDDPENLKQFLTTDEKDLDIVVLAPPEVLAKSMAGPKGERLHMDKEVKDMNEDGKYPLDSLANTPL